VRHRASGRQFGRNTNQRKALLRGLVANLFTYERIETTVTRAKEARKIAERLVTLGIKGDLNSRRVALSNMPHKDTVTKLFKEIAPRLQGRNGGYLRIVPTRRRVKDRAPMAVLEFVDYESTRKAESLETAKGKPAKEEKTGEAGKAEAAPAKEKKAPEKKEKIKKEKTGKKAGGAGKKESPKNEPSKAQQKPKAGKKEK
jgi:large subunit ribosomal protein L17